MIFSVFPLLLATVPSSSEHTMTTIKGQILVPRTSSRRAILPTRPRGRKWRNSSPTTEQHLIISVFPLLLATVPSSSEHILTTINIKGQILVPRTSSRRAILPTRPRGRKRRNSPPTTEQHLIISVFPLLLATVPSSSEHILTTINIKGQILVPLREERFFRRDLVDASGETHRQRRSIR